jgi:molybdopterin-guanine dinucleotide biosynthesis protein A
MLTIVIQAGGQSRRMGQNKALMPFHGQPLVQRIYERMKAIADEIILTTNQPDEYAFLQIAMAPDVMPGKGALGGLMTAFQRAAQPLVAVVACDLPFVNPGLIVFEKDLLLKNDMANAVIPLSAGGLEPMHAVYRRAVCLDSVRNALERGEMRVTSWLDSVPKQVLTETDLKPFDPYGITFINLNTPEEFQKAESLAASLGLD